LQPGRYDDVIRHAIVEMFAALDTRPPEAAPEEGVPPEGEDGDEVDQDPALAAWLEAAEAREDEEAP
jgi:hypothetical protein